MKNILYLSDKRTTKQTHDLPNIFFLVIDFTIVKGSEWRFDAALTDRLIQRIYKVQFIGGKLGICLYMGWYCAYPI